MPARWAEPVALAERVATAAKAGLAEPAVLVAQAETAAMPADLRVPAGPEVLAVRPADSVAPEEQGVPAALGARAGCCSEAAAQVAPGADRQALDRDLVLLRHLPEFTDGPGADMRDHLARRKAAGGQRGLEVPFTGEGQQKP